LQFCRRSHKGILNAAQVRSKTVEERVRGRNYLLPLWSRVIRGDAYVFLVQNLRYNVNRHFLNVTQMACKHMAQQMGFQKNELATCISKDHAMTEEAHAGSNGIVR
jgi:hypothetical protein